MAGEIDQREHDDAQAELDAKACFESGSGRSLRSRLRLLRNSLLCLNPDAASATPGDTVLVAAVGAGFTWGGAVLEWGGPA